MKPKNQNRPTKIVGCLEMGLYWRMRSSGFGLAEIQRQLPDDSAALSNNVGSMS